MIAIGVLAGCGGSSPSGSGGGPSPAHFRQQFVAFAACMRSHGLPSYPDPRFSNSADGVQVRISPGSLNPNTPAFKSAGQACHRLLASGGSASGAGANRQQEHAQGLAFAACMRSNRVPNFPDPDHDGAFNLPSEINQQAPQFQRAMHACMKVRPSSLLFNQGPGGA